MSIPNLKYKTTLCKNWEEGTFREKLKGTPCEKGPGCYFAHGEQELRKIEELTETCIFCITNNRAITRLFIVSFMRKVMYVSMVGQCKLGASCTFAHQKKEKRKMHKNVFYEQPLLSPMIQYTPPFFYPQYYNFGGQMYYGESISPFLNYQNTDQNEFNLNENHEINEIQPKSEEKKRASVGEISTSEKSPKNVENEEDQSEVEKKSSCFNIE